MRHRRLFVVLALLLAVNVSAQTITGSMSGTVADPQGDGIPGVSVTVVNENTGEERHGVTNETGDFIFPGLVPGPYIIRAQMTGFQPLEVKGHVVVANGRLAVGLLKLQLGELAETVVVSAQGEALATTRTSHQAILDVKQVQNLSIRGRDPISLLKILPGVSLLANDQETFGGGFATPVPNIQGGRGQTIYVDGINGGDGGGGGNFSGATNLDAIAEVNVQMSAYTAEYGLKGGSQVNFVTKRGGTEYHGTGYWYRRHEQFNATNFFNNRQGVVKPLYRYSTLGGNLGGPIPKIKGINPDGKKLYFFYSIDDTQVTNPQQLRRFRVPTELERQGDFSQTRTSNGALVPVRDPLTGQPFEGNRIPANRAHAAGLAYLNMLPLPNVNGDGFNFQVQEASIPNPRRQHLTRIDFRPTDRDTFSGKYQTWYTKSVGHNVSGASARWGLIRQRYDFTADQGKLDYTRILNSNTVLEVASGVFHSTENGPPENDEQLARIQRASFPGLAGLPQFAPRNNPLGLFPRVQFGNNLQTSGNQDWVPNIVYDNRWPITGADTALNGAVNLTHTRGSHTLKAGVMFEHERFGQARSGLFSGEFSFQNDGADPLNAGYAFANAYLGHVTSYTEAMGRVGDNRRQNTLAWFVQDTWKATRKLTLDLGLRMYRWSPPLQGGGEASGFSFDRFDPNWGGQPPILFQPVISNGARRARNPLTGEILPSSFIGQMIPGTGYTCGPITPTTPCQINGVVVQEDGSYVDGGRGFVQPLGVQFDPRFGLAYALNTKTVIRAAAGMFHDATGGSTFPGGPAFRFDRVVRSTDLDSYLTGSTSTSPVNVNGIARDASERPMSYRYTLAVQRDIGWNTVLDLAYVGDKTYNIAVNRNLNQVPAGARFLPENRDLTQPDSGTVGLQPNKANPGAFPDAYLRPVRGYGDINILTTDGEARYDSLQMQLTRRFTGFIELAGSYTWAKGFANYFDPDNNNTLRFFTGNGVDAQNSKNRQINIQEHVVVASYMIDIPNGSKLVKWGPAKWVLDDWSVSGISTFATGPWSNITATYTDNFDFIGGGESCAGSTTTAPYDLVGNPNLSRGDRSVDRWFDTSTVRRLSGRGQRGNNCSAAKVQLPGFTNHDLSVFKDVPLRGNHKMQFRWEIYNLLNHPQWNEVDTSAQFDAQGNQTDAQFGRVTSARTERRMQLSIRYSF